MRSDFLFLWRDTNSKPLGIFFHQPADDPLLEVDDDNHDQQAERDKLPAEKIGPGDVFDDMENDSADDRAPKCPFAAKQDHQDHENVERRRGECDIPRLDKARHVAENRARDAEEERGYGPRGALVAARVKAHGLCLFLVVTDRVDREPETGGIEPAKKNEDEESESEQQEIEEQLLRLGAARKNRHLNSGRRA